MVAIEALLNLGVKLDDLPKLPGNMNADWLNSVVKAKSQVISREFKDAIKSVKSLDTSVRNHIKTPLYKRESNFIAFFTALTSKHRNSKSIRTCAIFKWRIFERDFFV